MKHASLVMGWAVVLVPAAALAECPVTLPSSSPVHVPGSESEYSHAWYGSEALAVLIPKDGHWRGMGPSRNWGDKFWIWRQGYDAQSEPQPALTFSGKKLDEGVEPERMQIHKATNAYGKGWSQMLTGMQFPSAGCWQVTARYDYVGITQELTFVLDVE